MRRAHHWFAVLLAAFVMAIPFATTGCAMLSGESSVTKPKTGPGTDYPCGLRGMLCGDTDPPSCCSYGTCANDGEPYCDQRPLDPMDPNNFGVRKRTREPGKWVARTPLLASN